MTMPPPPSAPAPAPLVLIDKQYAPIYLVTINRAHVKNAVDRATARQLHAAFVAFAQDDSFSVAILRGAGETLCAGADLTAAFDNLGAVRSGSNPSETDSRANDLNADMDMPGPMGCSRMVLPKPVIACIEGYALAGGLELAAWCDLRVAHRTARLGVTCRTRGVPLIDGGTVRLPALIGRSRAADLILTGRFISAEEAFDYGFVNRLISDDHPNATLEAALQLARSIATKPSLCMRHDRLSMLGEEARPKANGREQGTSRPRSDGLQPCPYAPQGELRKALAREFEHGMISLRELGPGLTEFIHRPRTDGSKL